MSIRIFTIKWSLIALGFFIVSCHAVRAQNSDLKYAAETSSLYEEVMKFVADYPESSHRHLGWCGAAEDEYTHEFMRIVENAPPGDLIPLLHLGIPYLSAVIDDRLAALGEISAPTIRDAFENGSVRLKLSLMKYVHPDSAPQEYNKLLNELIHDYDSPLFYDDIRYMRNEHPDQPRPSHRLMKDYPVDIFTFYVRIINEADFRTERAMAAFDLARFGEEASGAVPDLINLLNGPDEYLQLGWDFVYDDYQPEGLRAAAAQALGKMGEDGLQAVPDLEKALNDEDVELRCCAATSLYRLGDKPDERVEFLIDMLRLEQEYYNQETIADHLALIGPAAIDALPMLYEIARSKQYQNVYYSGRLAIIEI